MYPVEFLTMTELCLWVDSCVGMPLRQRQPRPEALWCWVVHPYQSGERNISGRLQGIFGWTEWNLVVKGHIKVESVPLSWTPAPRGDILKFDANVSLDSRMNWSEHEGLEGILLVFADIELLHECRCTMWRCSPSVSVLWRENKWRRLLRLCYTGADLTFTIKTHGSFNFYLLMNQLLKVRCFGFRGRNGIRYS